MTERDVKLKLEAFREAYIQSYNSPSTQMDLREHFYLVRDESKTIHELMALMYDDFHKVMTDNKAQTLALMDRSIQTDTELYNYLLTVEHKLNKKPPIKKNFLMTLFTWSNIFKLLFLIGTFLIILFLIFEIDSNAYNTISGTILDTIDKFKKGN